MSNDPTTTKKQPLRRRLRIGLRSMLILVTLFGILFWSLWNFWWVPSQQQRQAVEQIKSRYDCGGIEHGDYRYEPMDDFSFWKKKLGEWLGRDAVARVTLAFSDGTGEPIDISPWAGLKSVEKVGFDHAIVDDLSVLENFRKLKAFSAMQSGGPTPPGKIGLEVLGDCSQLETVRLHESSFTLNDQVFDSICNAQSILHFEFTYERGLTNLALLKRLKHLEELYIVIYCRYTPPPSDLAVIGELRKLKKLALHLNYWSPTDFSFLKELKQLESCLITGDFSEELKQQIQSFLPTDCKVEFTFY